MELVRVTLEEQANDRIKLFGHVRYADDPSHEEIYWYDVPKTFVNDLSDSGNPWLACLLPLAMTLGEPLSLCLPVDTQLLDNAYKLMSIWTDWYPALNKISLEVQVNGVDSDTGKPKKTMAFFSGGIDSYFTLLHDRQALKEIDELICVWGFDVKTDNRNSFFSLYRRLGEVIRNFGVDFNYVATNVKETRLSQADWAKHYHGAAISSVALALEKRYQKALISSTHMDDHLIPWGSTHLTDPLFSTVATQIVHYGGEFNRVGKTGFVAQSIEVMNSLKVCAVSRSDKNCSWCSKCYRSMLNFELLGVLDKCNCFDSTKFSIDAIKKVYLPDDSAISFFEELRDLAIKKGRKEIVKAIGECYQRSKRLSKLLEMVDSLRNKPFIWRYAEPLKRWILRDSI